MTPPVRFPRQGTIYGAVVMSVATCVLRTSADPPRGARPLRGAFAHVSRYRGDAALRPDKIPLTSANKTAQGTRRCSEIEHRGRGALLELSAVLQQACNGSAAFLRHKWAEAKPRRLDVESLSSVRSRSFESNLGVYDRGHVHAKLSEFDAPKHIVRFALRSRARAPPADSPARSCASPRRSFHATRLPCHQS